MKYGHKNEIKLDPLKYNLALIGEGGIGKTTLIKQYCDKLAPESYLFLEIAKEDGADAINGLNYITCPDWDSDYSHIGDIETIGFKTIIDDIVENKNKDWADLKVVVIDTIDELFAIAEPEVIAMHNRTYPAEKHVKSIKAAFGGFQAGEEKAIEIVLEALWSLKTVGVSFIVIGHTKNRTQTDPVTGGDYLQLTTNLSQKYFNAIKTKVHFLGTAYINREIVKEKTGKKDIKTNKDIMKGVVKSEQRQITFRDDTNFVIDSKSRFAEIEGTIPFDVDAFEKAIRDAILKEHAKSGKTVEQSMAEQNAIEAERMKNIAMKEDARSEAAKLDTILAQIGAYIKSNKDNIMEIKPLLDEAKAMGYTNPMTVDNLSDATKLLAMING